MEPRTASACLWPHAAASQGVWALPLTGTAGHLTPLGLEEPQIFVEPGLFLIRPDRTLYFASVQNMPFARPPLGEVLRMIAWTVENRAPARGDVEEPPEPA